MPNKLSFELRPDLDRGPGYGVVSVSGLDVFPETVKLIIRSPADTKVLGPVGWQAAEYQWNTMGTRHSTTMLEVIVGPDIVAHMSSGNYILELLDGNNGNSVGEGVLVWKVVAAIASSNARTDRRRPTRIGLQPTIPEREFVTEPSKKDDSDIVSKEPEVGPDESTNPKASNEREDPKAPNRQPLLIAAATGVVVLMILIGIAVAFWPSDPNPSPRSAISQNETVPDAQGSHLNSFLALLEGNAPEAELLNAGRALQERGLSGEAASAYRQIVLGQDSAEAMRRMGELYDPRTLFPERRGQMDTPTPSQAVRWYRKAAQKGDEVARGHLRELENWARGRPEGDELARKTLEALGGRS